MIYTHNVLLPLGYVAIISKLSVINGALTSAYVTKSSSCISSSSTLISKSASNNPANISAYTNIGKF